MMSPVALVDCGIGNIASVVNMLKHVGASPVLTRDADTLRRAERLILPGVGAFDAGIQHLRAAGLVDVLIERARAGA